MSNADHIEALYNRLDLTDDPDLIAKIKDKIKELES